MAEYDMPLEEQVSLLVKKLESIHNRVESIDNRIESIDKRFDAVKELIQCDHNLLTAVMAHVRKRIERVEQPKARRGRW